MCYRISKESEFQIEGATTENALRRMVDVFTRGPKRLPLEERRSARRPLSVDTERYKQSSCKLTGAIPRRQCQTSDDAINDTSNDASNDAKPTGCNPINYLLLRDSANVPIGLNAIFYDQFYFGP